jgi:thiamine biosynthesis protein ThiS
MEIMVNGEQVSCAENITLENLLLQLKYDKRQIAVELNEVILPKAEYEQKIICAGDEIEVVTFMGGGN